MSLRNVLALLAAAQAVVGDSSHPMYFRKVDANTARSIGVLKNTTPRGGDGALVNEQGFWFSHFTVGASQDLVMLIDTGSSNAILNPGIYQPSSASHDQHRRFNISYATTNPDGSGTLSQVIGLVDSPSSPPTFPHDGLIGYAGKTDSSLREDPFFFSLCATRALSACRFGLSLRTDGTGQMHYGTVAADEFHGDLTTVKTTSLWSVPAAVTVNGGTIVSDMKMATDSGTTVIFGPKSALRKVFQAAGIEEVATARGIEGHYRCSDSPAVGFSLGGKNFNIVPKALAYKKNGDDCTVSILGTVNASSTWLVGQAFFQGRYIDHNVDDKTMGFANLK